MERSPALAQRRRIILGSFYIILCTGISRAAFAENCSSNHIAKLQNRCLDILNDVASTIQTGRNLETAAWAKAQAAIQPSYDCAKGGYELGKALFKDCNPSSPAVNPVACVETLVGVPDTVEACKDAITLVREAWSLYEQAAFIYGTADVAFFDQGGDEVADALDKCGEPSCWQISRSLSKYAQQSKERAGRNRDRLKQYEGQLIDVRRRLGECLSSSSSCSELPQYEFPALEANDSTPPAISLH